MALAAFDSTQQVKLLRRAPLALLPYTRDCDTTFNSCVYQQSLRHRQLKNINKSNEKERFELRCEILWRIRACFIQEITMAMNRNRQNVRLPPEVNRVLYVRNLPYKITGEEMYDIFGKYGAIRYA